MSEFQVYKFRSIDRLLTRTEQDEISSWSSRTRATANGATFTYAYGDFRKNEEKVFREYFDLFLYFANWGTRRLMLKFPRDLVDFKSMQAYDINADHAYTTHLEVSKTANYVIVEFYWAEEEGGDWVEEEDFEVSDFIPIREAILNGDYSALYLFWLKLAESKADWDEDDYDEDDYVDHVDYHPEDYEGNPDDDLSPRSKIPPIPPKLRYVGASMQAFLDFLEIDKDLVAAAKTASKEVAKEEAKRDYKALLQQLTEEEKDEYLWQLLQGELRLEIKLKKHLDALAPTASQEVASLSLVELKQQKVKAQSDREAAEQKAAERAHVKKMKELASEKDALWKSVFKNIGMKQGYTYDRAVATLVDLKALAKYEGEGAAFQKRMEAIKKDYVRSRVLINRFINAGL